MPKIIRNTEFKIGDKVLFDDRPAEILKIIGRKARISYWIKTFGMTKPELRKSTVPLNSLSKKED